MSEAAQPAPPRPTPPQPLPSWSVGAWTQTPMARVGLILLLLMLLQIPLFMVSSLIEERQGRQSGVIDEIGQSWGPAQVVAGPMLAVPFIRTVPPARAGDEPVVEHGWARLAPFQARFAAQMQPEVRRRGLFHATVYTASVDVGGEFRMAAFTAPSGPPVQMLWDGAVLAVGASDLRGQAADTPAELNGKPATLSVQEVQGTCSAWASIPAGLQGPPEGGATVPFHAKLTLRGTETLGVLPAGRQAHVRMEAPWATPGFTGSTLPVQHTLAPAGFDADWDVVGGASTGAWQFDRSNALPCANIGAGNAVSVSLLQPVATYQMVTRASKYGTMFLVLAFLTYFLFEAAGRTRIHPVQYALLGLSVSLFALLLVALAEPLGFVPGYALATAAVMGQASLYTWSVVGSWRLASVFALVLGTLFGFLYVVISLDSYALLVGTGAVFAALSALMVATRRLDWGGRISPPDGTAGAAPASSPR